MIALVLNPLVLIALMWLLARHEADMSYLKVFGIVFAISIIALLLALVHPLVGMLGYLILIPLALHRFCYVRLTRALAITGLFIVWQIVFRVVFDSITKVPA
jgi:hypothetical protein